MLNALNIRISNNREAQMKTVNKVVVIFVVVFVLILSSVSFAQLGIRKGFKVGYSSATLTGDNVGNVDPLKKMTGGICLEFNLLVLSFEGDILYSVRGADLGQGGKEEITYISVPLMLKKKFLPMLVHPYMMGGLEFNYLLSANADGTDIKSSLNSQDMCMTVGCGVEFSFLGRGAFGEVRYSYGINNLLKDTSLPAVHHRVAHLMFGILF